MADSVVYSEGFTEFPPRPGTLTYGNPHRMPEHRYLQQPVFRRSVVAAFQRSLTRRARRWIEPSSLK
jgi:hypothetical protein